MTELAELVINVVALAGGRMVGRTRLQKTIYLLHALDMESDATYYYYNFGPFSDEITDGISDGKFSGLLSEQTSYRVIDGSPFSIFETLRKADEVQDVGGLSADEARGIIQILEAQSSTVLELAATIHWLKHIEQIDDWRAELGRRKGAKTENGRMEKAYELLQSLNIA